MIYHLLRYIGMRYESVKDSGLTVAREIFQYSALSL